MKHLKEGLIKQRGIVKVQSEELRKDLTWVCSYCLGVMITAKNAPWREAEKYLVSQYDHLLTYIKNREIRDILNLYLDKYKKQKGSYRKCEILYDGLEEISKMSQ